MCLIISDRSRMSEDGIVVEVPKTCLEETTNIDLEDNELLIINNMKKQT